MNAELRDHIKSIDYILIDYTSKIKDINDYIQMILKAHQEKYYKCLFYIQLLQIKDEIREVIRQLINCDYPSNDIVVFYNKDNYTYHSNHLTISKIFINQFIGYNKGELYKCCICLNDNLTTINPCRTCNANTCKDCIIKSMLSKGKNEIKCVICKSINGSIIVK